MTHQQQMNRKMEITLTYSGVKMMPEIKTRQAFHDWMKKKEDAGWTNSSLHHLNGEVTIKMDMPGNKFLKTYYGSAKFISAN